MARMQVLMSAIRLLSFVPLVVKNCLTTKGTKEHEGCESV